MENIYNRLVRDNIPDICISNNQKSKFRELDDLKYVSALNEELKEDIDNMFDEESKLILKGLEKKEIIQLIDNAGVEFYKYFDK